MNNFFALKDGPGFQSGKKEIRFQITCLFSREALITEFFPNAGDLENV